MAQFIGSTTPLAATGAGATFTSRWVLADAMYVNVTGSAFADQAGTIVVQQSGDGINADVSNSTPVVASTGVSFNVPIVLPYIRLQMVNTSGVAQTALRVFSRMVLNSR